MKAYKETVRTYYKYDTSNPEYNITAVGSLTNTNGVLSGFSSSNYALTPILNAGTSAWELVICFTTPSSFTRTETLINQNSSTASIFISINSAGKFYDCCLSSSGSTWNIWYSENGVTNLSPSTKYWMKIKYTGSAYKLLLSTTGAFAGEETTEISNTSSYTMALNQQYILGKQYSDYDYWQFSGTIDLHNCYFKVLDEYKWQGVTYPVIEGTSSDYDYYVDTPYYKVQRTGKPYYCEVQYLQSSGTQYIDTGINADSNLGVETYCQLTETTANQYMGAIKQISGGYTRHHLSVTNDSIYSYHLSTLRYDFTTNTNIHYIKYNAQTHVLTFDTTTQNTTTNTFDTGLNYWLFARNASSGMSTAYMNIRIYYFKMTYNGELVRDFIPVVDWDMTPCMYDRVSGKLFYNKGTGDFTCGRQIHPVEYLESTGTQYINTGVILSNLTNPRIETECALTTASSPTFIMGTYSTGTSPNSIFFINDARVSYAYSSNSQLYIEINNSDLKYHYYNASYNNGTFSLSGDFTGTASYSKLCNKNLYLFARNTDGTVTYCAGAKIKYVKIYSGGELIRHFIPAVDKNGVGFMFDTVSHQCFVNSGTGNFKYPPVEIEYIQSTGTQYINTGIVPEQTTKAQADFQLTEVPTDTYAGLLGSLNDSYQGFFVALNYTVPIQARTGSNTNTNVVSTYSVNTDRYDITLEFNKLTVNGDVFTPSSDNTWITMSRSMYLLAVDGRSTDLSRRMIKAKLYSSKVWNGATLVRDFVPVLKDGSAGLLDKVNNVFYTNAGTGSFTAGKVIDNDEQVYKAFRI